MLWENSGVRRLAAQDSLIGPSQFAKNQVPQLCTKELPLHLPSYKPDCPCETRDQTSGTAADNGQPSCLFFFPTKYQTLFEPVVGP